MEKTTVKEIHSEFYDFATTTSKALQDLDLNLAKDKKVYEKSKKLQEMGFKNANQIDDPEATFEYYKQEHEDITELTFKYPGWKFISKRGIEHISKKYGLFHGAIEHFTGNIPEKNMNDILNSQDKVFTKDTSLRIDFEMKSKYFIPLYQTDSVKASYIPGSETSDFTHDSLITCFNAFYQDHKDFVHGAYIKVKIVDNNGHEYSKQVFGSDGYNNYDIGLASVSDEFLERERARERQRERQAMFMVTNFLSSRENNARDGKETHWEKDARERWVKDSIRNIHKAYEKAQENVDTQYSIIANHSDFNQLVGPEGNPIEIEVPKIQLPDPVVLKKTYKKGYYAIITAWDKEAMDPLVFNENLN